MLSATPTARACIGDCDDDRRVEVAELLSAIGVALGDAPIDRCPRADNDLDGRVRIPELVLAVRHALDGCGGGPEGEVLYAPSANRLDIYELGSGRRLTLVAAARNHVNGQVCLVGDGSGRFVVAEDTGQPAERAG